ncbi:hypothetical protein AHAS_Ahas08G0026900 [Arachis hypogaea]
MKALGWWLLAVGTLRLASVWFGFFNIWALRLGVFSNTTMTEVHGRTFGTWTLLTCTLCYIYSKSVCCCLFCRNIDYVDAIAMEFAWESPLEAFLERISEQRDKSSEIM